MTAAAPALGPLVDAEWLRARLGRDPDLRVVDCRWRLGEPGWGEREHRAGHIPDAAFLDVDRDLAAPPGPGGRHPLPDPPAFERAARRAGIGRGSRVIAVDEAGEGAAARLWWLLRHFGHEAVAVLDGGMRAWRAAGLPLATGAEDEAAEPGDFRAAAPHDGDTVTMAELRERIGDPTLVLLDARARERYRGEREPIDPVAGHIPRAHNVPFAELVPEGRFPPPPELRGRLEEAGARPGAEAVVYCGSGVTSCVVALAAATAGIDRVRIYPGSWSEWSANDGPVETGEAL